MCCEEFKQIKRCRYSKFLFLHENMLGVPGWIPTTAPQKHISWVLIRKYEGKSISNQPIAFPIDRDTQDFHALFQYMF